MIAICPNPFRDKDCELSLRAQELLRDAGFESCICPIFCDEGSDAVPDGVDTQRLEDVAPDCSLVVVVGGDGTILAAARALTTNQIPILGVNLGSKGFMSALEPDELSHILEAAKGAFRVSRRMKLDVELYREGELIYSDCALNDAVLHGYGDCIKMEVSCGGASITAFSGDGIVLATPTGSTGYSMSAGGPIVEPEAEALIVSPICAHSMGTRPFVLGPDSEVTVKMEKLHVRRAYLSVDGSCMIDLVNNDIVRVRRSKTHTLMADMGLRSFYEIAYGKLR